MNNIELKMNILNINNPIDINDTSCDYEVNKIVDHRVVNGKWSFLVRWKGWSSKYDEWVKDEDCYCEKQISEYLEKKNINTVYCFCRKSCKGQNNEYNTSLTIQSKKIYEQVKLYEKYNVEEKRIKIIKVYGSAYNGMHKTLLHIGEAAHSGDVIAIYRIDRLSRDIVAFISWVGNVADKGIRICSVQDNIWYTNDMSRIERNNFVMLVLNVEKESATLSMRICDSLEERRERGDHIGGTKYGMKTQKINGRVILVSNPEEQDIIEYIIKSRNRLKRKFNDIARDLNINRGPKRGRKWNGKMVKNLYDKHA